MDTQPKAKLVRRPATALTEAMFEVYNDHDELVNGFYSELDAEALVDSINGAFDVDIDPFGPSVS